MASALAHPSGRPTHAVLAAGETLGRYELLAELARGGMGVVWFARYVAPFGFVKFVVVKTILPALAEDDVFRAMFLDEARIAARIDSPHVAKVIDLGEQEGQLFMAMEYIDGHSLSFIRKALLKAKTPCPLPALVRILSDVCAGLSAAHGLLNPDGTEAKVIHRDISHENIMIDASGVAKIIDFGIAKAWDRLTPQTSADVFKGRVRYMSPEAARREELDARADLYALGMVAYELLALRSPYRGENQFARMMDLLSSTEPLPPLPESVPPPLARVVYCALERDRERRFDSALAMRGALEEAAAECLIVPSHTQVQKVYASTLRDCVESRRRVFETLMADAERRDSNHRVTLGPAPQKKTTPDAAPSTPSPIPIEPARRRAPLRVGLAIAIALLLGVSRLVLRHPSAAAAAMATPATAAVTASTSEPGKPLIDASPVAVIQVPASAPDGSSPPPPPRREVRAWRDKPAPNRATTAEPQDLDIY